MFLAAVNHSYNENFLFSKRSAKLSRSAKNTCTIRWYFVCAISICEFHYLMRSVRVRVEIQSESEFGEF